MKTVIFVVVAGSCLGLGACATQPKACCDENERWSSTLEDSIADYQDRMACVTPVYQVAPWQCRPPQPSGPRMSRAKGGKHAWKLYHLYVSDEEAYSQATQDLIPNPIGLTLIKESHVAIAVEPGMQLGKGYSIQPERDGAPKTVVMFEPGDISSLFIMSKVGDEHTPGTDRGWVYGGATPEGEVYASGLIQSCMDCHVDAPHDRLFGLAPATTVYFSEE